MTAERWVGRLASIIMIAVAVCGTQTVLAERSQEAFDTWDLEKASAQIIREAGREVLEMDSGTAYLPDVRFLDGTIEVDMAPAEGFVFGGFVFRATSHANAEEVYVRLNKSGLPDAVQYAPRQNGLTAWQLYSGDGFTAPARFSRTDWIELRAEVSGRTARFFVDDEPVLVARLQHPPTAGRLGLYGISGARFADFRYAPASSADVAASQSGDRGPSDPHMLSDWDLSGVMAADAVQKEMYDAVSSETDWVSVVADSSGLVNIGKYRVKSAAGSGDAIVFARTTIESDGAQRRRMSFGYSDEVRIYLNGRPLFEGNSRWRARDALFLGTIGLNDHLFLDLIDGENELVFAVTEWFGGWGVMARLE